MHGITRKAGLGLAAPENNDASDPSHAAERTANLRLQRLLTYHGGNV